ncbi:ATPase [Winogradskyella wichelsiae]|uniref:ATPase n=1 Tax=Winogradskyella wichelsiae TaxID=2697007 RepID=UPI0015CD44CD|nr:ATPase [Winogradskyella wichelsiae]
MTKIASTYNVKNPSIIYEGATQFQLGSFDGKSIVYDFPKIRTYLDAKGKICFGENFKIYEDDHRLLLKLASYFIQDHDYCQKLNIDTAKGILLSGPVGCGKTTLLKLLQYLVPHRKSYNVIPARNIVFGFNSLGFKMIEDYSDNKVYCFDDLGVEHIGRHYGKDCNVMGEILLSRYDLFKEKGIKTHLTTNLNAEEIEDKYGERVRSRMRAMFNLLTFPAGSSDKRM